MADKKRILEVFDNLLSNAIKYTHKGAIIQISILQSSEDILVEFRDEGQGLSEDEISGLFVKFTKLCAIPTGKERSDGLGLSIVKTLVDLHGGSVWARSDGKNKGSSFFVSLPASNKNKTA